VAAALVQRAWGNLTRSSPPGFLAPPPASMAVNGARPVPGPPMNGKKKGLKRQRSRRGSKPAGCRDGMRSLRFRRSMGECPQVVEATESRPAVRDLRTIVVNLDRRPDRMDGCVARLAAHCPELRCERFAATDGRNDVIPANWVGSSWHTGRNVVYQRMRAIRKNWNDLDTYRERTLELSPGERGCAASHIRAWQRCLELAGDTERPLLVLEDDAAPTAEFEAVLSRALAALPADAHLLYLGYSQAAEWRRHISPDLVESEYVWTTVGYIVWPAGARLLLSKLPVDQPVDNWMALLCAEDDVKAYCVRPKIVHQAEAWNVNSDVAHSDEHYWGPDSDIRHSDEFYWGPEEAKGKGAKLSDGNAVFWDIDSEDSEGSA